MNLPTEISTQLNASRGKIAVITILGSFCPITRAHVELFVKTREYLQEHLSYHCVLGFISLNSQGHVSHKLLQKGQRAISYEERVHLIHLATQEIPWLNYSKTKEFQISYALRQRWPHLEFVHYSLNGADDVIKYQKWRYASQDYRLIVLLRPGFSDILKERMKQDGVQENPNCILLPEISSGSSSSAREALEQGDSNLTQELLHPDVLDWCRKHAPYQPK